ncbi:MAG: hypothetical protein ORO03_10765, partial [Alphaproteobacteria bacterium]|nr:hypothetical protein [Alphaproteobacteria bacterium]
MVTSVQAPNRSSSAPASVGGAAGLVALLGRGAASGSGLGDGFAELVAQTRNLSAISGTPEESSRPREASAAARDKNLENFAARIQRDIDRLKARDQINQDQQQNQLELRKQAQSDSESAAALRSPLDSASDSPPTVARKAATDPNSGAESPLDSPLDQLSPEEKQQLIDQLAQIMASLTERAGTPDTGGKPHDLSDGTGLNPSTEPSATKDSTESAQDPMLDLAATVLAMFLAAAKAEGQKPAPTETTGNSVQSGAGQNNGAPSASAILPTAGDHLPAAMDASVQNFVNNNAEAIRKAFSQAQHKDESGLGAAGAGANANANGNAAGVDEAPSPTSGTRPPPSAGPSSLPDPNRPIPRTAQDRLNGLLAENGGAIVAGAAPVAAAAEVAPNSVILDSPDAPPLPAATAVPTVGLAGQTQAVSHSLHSADAAEPPMAAV